MRKRLIEVTKTALLLVLDDDINSLELDSLSDVELQRIVRWAHAMHSEASDNPCRAGAAPKCLRKLLPPTHYLQKWRMPKR